MPTYDYLCPNGHRFEVIHSVIADGPTSCPICGASPVRKAFSAPTIHFKGSGWAKKDRSTASRSASKAASAAAESGSGAGSDAGETTASATDKPAGSSTDGSATSEAKPSADKTASQGTGKGTGPTGNAGPPAAD
jgi:putative FmdB family regulatory protein